MVQGTGRETIRTVSRSGRGVTVRHRPWVELLGPGPVGATCGDCQHLERVRKSKTFFRCGRQITTCGPGSDIRKREPACRLFAST